MISDNLTKIETRYVVSSSRRKLSDDLVGVPKIRL